LKNRFSLALVLPVVLLLASGPAAALPMHVFGGYQQSPNQPFVMLTPEEVSGGQYCKQTGGKVEVRTPVYGTNVSSSKGTLVLSGHAVFCRYTAKDTSTIHVLATTLNATMPTLAALAYYAKVSTKGMTCTGDPSSCYCTLLGGSDQFGGTTFAGGAWVLKGGVDEDLHACIFPDLSSIDSWGLTYHSEGAIRGIDLGTVLRFKNPFHHH